MPELVGERQSEIVRDVCSRFRLKRLELFGPAASGRFRPGDSGLDFLVKFQPPFGQGYADRYIGLLSAL